MSDELAAKLAELEERVAELEKILIGGFGRVQGSPADASGAVEVELTDGNGDGDFPSAA